MYGNRRKETERDIRAKGLRKRKEVGKKSLIEKREKRIEIVVFEHET